MARSPLSPLLALLVGLWPASSGAVLFTVDSTVDAVDANPGDGICADSTGACTLRAAIEEANALGGADDISLPEGSFHGWFPHIFGELTLTGVGANRTTVEGPFLIEGPWAVRIAHVTIEGADRPGAKWGITIFGASVELDSVVVKENADGGVRQIGGYQVGSSLRVMRSAIHGNGQWGIAALPYDLPPKCQPLCCVPPGGVEVENSTVSGNPAGAILVGGCAYGGPRAQLEGSTLHANYAVALSVQGVVDLQLRSSIVAGIPDCAFDGASVTSFGHNLDGDGSCGLSDPTDLSNVQPLLGPLADNGGETPTHTPLPGSPAIDAIPVEDCTYDDDGDPGTPEVRLTTDQRGSARPKGGGCDIGAVEVPEPAHALMLAMGAWVLAAARKPRPPKGFCWRPGQESNLRPAA